MIQTKITKDIYHGDGTIRRFEVTFDYNTKDNIKQIDLYTCTYTIEEGVTKYNNDVTKITSNYDFEVVNDVTYAVYPSDAAVSDGATPMATGTAIIIMRNTPNEQLSTGQYTSEKVEKQLDRITMVAQELQEQLNRAYQAPEYVDKVNKADFATVANDIDAVNTVAAITEDIDLVNANAENITTVAQNIEDVNATGQNIEDVNTVALNINNVSTVAGISSDVTQVAGISTAVSNVSDKSSDVTLVSDNMASVMTTASSITDVQTVAGIATDVSTVADNNTNVTAVAGNSTNINTVANKINKVETVADNISSVNTVSANISDVTNVSDNMTTISEVVDNIDDVIAAADAVELVLPHIDEINNVSDNINDIVTVAGINADVSTVATNSSDISSVADNATNINTVASNVSNIATAVSNMAAIIAAPTAATNAANSALNAATSATNAQKWAEGTDADVQPLGGTKSSKGWANRAQELVESIGTVMRYKGSVANYAALQAIQNPTLGDTYNVLDTGANYSWDGTAWDEIGSAVDLSAYRTSADQDLIDAGKVSKTGTETIAGVKTFSDGIVANVTGNLTGTASNATNAASATKATQDGDGNTISSTYIKVSTKGVASGVASLDSNTKVPVSQLPVMTGADGVNAGVTGSVPAPAATDNTKFLKGDGTWANPTSSSSWGSITGDLEDQTDLQNELDSKAPAVLLSHFWSDHIINEMSYLRGDTFSWQSGDVYTAAYNHLANDLYKDFLFDFRNDSDYYIYGSPTIQDGIVSDITDKQNTIGTASAISLTDNDSLEIKLKLLNTGNSTRGLFDTITSIDSRCMLNTSSGIFWVVNYNSSTSSTVTLPISTFDWRNRDVLYIKLNCSHKDSDDNTTYSISVSTDDISWVTVSSVANYRIQNLALRFGSSGNSLSYGTAVPYSIDLNESYVKKNTVQTETIGNYTITYYEAADGHKICLADQEPTIYNLFNEYGAAWYYILDTVNTRFKLPRTRYGFVGLRDGVGNYVEESLPNIKGDPTYGDDNSEHVKIKAWNPTGCFVAKAVSNTMNSDGIAGAGNTATFDASASSSTYQDDAHVQQRATQMYLYFYVGTFTKTAYQETAGLNSELFNGKADRNLSNVTGTSGFRKLISANKTGNAWYKVYAEYDPSTGAFLGNWCEQGDSVARTSAAATTITFPIPFADTTYTLVQNYRAGTSNGNTGENENGYYNKTTTGFTNKSAVAVAYFDEISYIAEGYI